MQYKTGIEQALDKFESSPSKLAKAIGGSVIRQHVEHWIKAGRVPAEKAPDVEAATGIPVELLSPDTNWALIRGIKAKAKSDKAASHV
jgi:DNA-binding transcriptional regulator YdaS (Cro superfamily)